ncbi:hypothetical protein, partial [Pectobacterium polaris]|uniref:hypothetical protein n=1 Tax=Pectobacterium polaris TaxID=2042057 RepID=UPI0020BDE8F3
RDCLRCQGMHALILQLSKSSIYSTKPERLISFFPDAEGCRRGVKSIFSPGPRGNLPQLEIERQNRNKKRRRNESLS